MTPFSCFFVALLAAHCAPTPAIFFSQPEGAERFIPPSWYAQIWWETENCTGLRGDLREVTFYRVPKPFLCSAGWCRGMYARRPHAIYFVASEMMNRELVAHEMAHALGVPDHPPEIYDRCVY